MPSPENALWFRNLLSSSFDKAMNCRLWNTQFWTGPKNGFMWAGLKRFCNIFTFNHRLFFLTTSLLSQQRTCFRQLIVLFYNSLIFREFWQCSFLLSSFKLKLGNLIPTTKNISLSSFFLNSAFFTLCVLIFPSIHSCAISRSVTMTMNIQHVRLWI